MVSLVLVAVLGFFLFRVLPGDPVRTMTRDRPGDLAAARPLRTEFGLDKPLPQQFVDYLLELLRGDLGTSYTYQQPVGDADPAAAVARRCCWSARPLLIAVALGLWLGSRAAWRRGSAFDRFATASRWRCGRCRRSGWA